MTSTEMLARLISLLDDTASGSGFYPEADLYGYLTTGQVEVAKFIHKSNPKSGVIKPLLKEDLVTSGYSKAIPSDFEDYYAASYAYDGSSYKKAELKSYDEYLGLIENPYLMPSKNTPIVYFKGEAALGGKYYYYPSNSSAKGTLTYIANTSTIDATHDSSLNPIAHEAIVQYAFHLAQLRNGDPGKAAQALKTFEILAGAV